MLTRKKVATLVALVAIVGLIASCAPPTPKVVEKEVTKVVEKEVEVVVTPTPAPTKPPEIVAYKIGIFEEPRTLNYWNYLGPGSSVWTRYVMTGYSGSLYSLSDQRFQFVPVLAKELPPEPKKEGEVWTVTVEMVEDARWSDGEPITAHDVVFTHNTCKDLKLTENWPSQCAPMGIKVEAEAVDDFTVKYSFATEDPPGLGVWQMGVAMAPIMPKRFWADTVAEARSFIEEAEKPEVERPEKCEPPEELTAEEKDACEAWAAYDEAFENARKTLYEADPTGTPIFGGYISDKWEKGAFVRRSPNENYYFKGAKVTEYEDETWVREWAGRRLQLYGGAKGEKTLEYTGGPYCPNVIHSIYGSQDAAYLAMVDGEVDYVLNPLGIARGLREKAEKAKGIVTYTNDDYGMFYLAFNLRKPPMSDPAFREAVDAVIDKEFVTNKVMQGVVFPMYSTMPPGNKFYYNPDVPKPFVGLSREERVNKAVEVLKEAGWTWEVEPAWNPDKEDVDPGEGLRMPNGEPMPEITILGPGPAYDPIRATFNQWISEWMRELGMPVKSEVTGFNVILTPVFIEANFDMYILGWSLGNPAFPDYYEAFWHSRNDTATTGNFNTPGYKDEEFDAMAEEFMSTTSIERARELVFDMQVKIAEDRPYIPLFYKPVIDLIRDNIKLPYTETLSGIVEASGFQTDSKVMAW